MTRMIEPDEVLLEEANNQTESAIEMTQLFIDGEFVIAADGSKASPWDVAEQVRGIAELWAKASALHDKAVGYSPIVYEIGAEASYVENYGDVGCSGWVKSTNEPSAEWFNRDSDRECLGGLVGQDIQEFDGKKIWIFNFHTDDLMGEGAVDTEIRVVVNQSEEISLGDVTVDMDSPTSGMSDFYSQFGER